MTANRLHILCVLLALSCGLAGGCYDQKQVQAFLQKTHSPVSGREYRVLPPDVITVSSRHVPEINNLTQQVRPDGKVNLPMVGEVLVAGLTAKEIEKSLTTAAAEFYEQVDATVTISQYNSQRYYVYGQVERAGPMPWTGRDSLLDALAKAQPTYLAWPERIIVVRGNEPKVGGFATTYPVQDKHYESTGVHKESSSNPSHELLINLMAMIQHGDMANNILLEPNDVIYVQPNPLAAVGLALQSLLFPVRPVLEATRVPATVAGATSVVP